MRIRSIEEGAASAVRTVVASFADVRCLQCGRLLFRWHPSGVAVMNVKCTRCGKLDTLALSTG